MSANLATRLRENAGRFPEKPVFIYPGPDRSWQTVSYRQLSERSQLLARGLCACGLRPGARAVLMAAPSPDFFALVFALLQTGLVPVMLDPAIGLGNVTTCLAAARPEVYFGSALTHLLRRLFGWGKQSLRLNLSIADVLRAAKSAPEVAPPLLRPESEAAIVYTSGSTGLPKGALFSQANFVAQIEMLVNALDLRGDEIDLPAFPLFALIDCLLGVTAVIPDMRFPRPARVEPAKMVAAIRDQRVDTMFVSPAALERLARYGLKNRVTLPGLKRVFTAGAPAPAPVQEMFRRMLPDSAELVGIYGSTETLPVTIVNSREVLDETRYLSAQGAGVCIGRPVAGAQVRVMPIRDEAVAGWSEALNLPVGQIGEITVKGGAVTEAYVGQEKATTLAKIRDVDGNIIHRMGDVGYFDEKGRLWYCGRKSHRVVTRAGTLFSEALEGIFNAHALVHRSALVGLERAGVTEPVLWVELIPSARRADHKRVRAELLELAQTHEMAHAIKTILFHPAFPTDVRHNSKIIREKLAELAKKEAGMKTLVTGATGFLGKALARRLKSRGDEVTALGRNPLILAELEREGLRPVRADLADAAAVRAACRGQEIVFHSGALSSAWGRARDFYLSNVVGTQNVIAGCEAESVRRLVHVSTPSIYFGYAARLNVREDAPLPKRPANEYARTKLLAEAEIERAFARGLAVITIRPRAIFGEGDNAILPRLIARLRQGRLRVIGDGQNITDLTYVENVVDALLLCAEAPQTTLGRKYNITNGEPLPLWALVRKLCLALGYEFPRRHIPYPLAMGLAGALEGVCRLLPGQPEPLLTRYMVGVLAKSTTLDISAARRDLGYQPRVSVDEGFQRFVHWWQQENL